MEAVLTQHIVMTPDTCSGKPRIAGRRVRVQDIVAHILFLDGTAESAAKALSLTLAEVHSAMAFYYDNKQMIDEHFAQEEHFEAEFRQEHPDRVAN